MHKGHGPLPPGSQRFIRSTPTRRLRTGLKAVVEITAYPRGHFGLSVSRIGAAGNARTITIAETLPLNDTDEVKDHTDAIIDFLVQQVAAMQAEAAGAAAGADHQGDFPEE